MSKLYAIRQTGKSNYWYDFVEDFTSSELDGNCISNNFAYVKECQNNLGSLNPAWKNSEIVEFRELGEKDDFEDLYYKSLEQRADLEAKLAELNKEPLNCSQLENGMSLCIIQKSEIVQLKQQLAGKEKERHEEWKTGKEWKWEWQKVSQKLEKADQDKISFAVKKLKETQIYVDNQHFMNARYKCEKKVYADIWNFIDNQIKQLKEMK